MNQNHWLDRERVFLFGPTVTWTEIARLRELKQAVSESRDRVETMIREARLPQERIERESIFLALDSEMVQKLERDISLI